MLSKKNLNSFLSKKKVLITGHTGFKGSWLVSILSKYDCKIYGISSRNFDNKLNYNFIKNKISKEFFFDICNIKRTSDTISYLKPDIIFHLAAQSLVFTSYKSPYFTMINNFNSTLSILETLKNYNRKLICIFITSDKVYQNNDKKIDYKETDILKGDDPYSASKVSIEMAIHAYSSILKKNKLINFGVARAGNVIGGGDWSNDRIIPDAYKAWNNKKKIVIRNPKATRPWQHVLEPLYGYILFSFYLSKKKELNGETLNFGPKNSSKMKVIDIVKKLNMKWSNKNLIILRKNKFYKEHNLLSLNSKKALKNLNWKTILSYEEICEFIHDWYSNYLLNKFNKKKMLKLIYQQITIYEKKFFNDNFK